MYPKFSLLRERLLREGLPPNRVHRLILELREHFEDLIECQCRSGATLEEASSRALTRIGEESNLALAMLENCPRRSLAFRAPYTVFVMVPTILQLAVVMGVAMLMMRVLWPMRASAFYEMPGGYRIGIALTGILVNYGLWIAVSACSVIIAIRQRSESAWVMVGLVLMAAISTLFGFHAHLGAAGGPGRDIAVYSMLDIRYSHGRPDFTQTYLVAAARGALEAVIAIGAYRVSDRWLVHRSRI